MGSELAIEELPQKEPGVEIALSPVQFESKSKVHTFPPQSQEDSKVAQGQVTEEVKTQPAPIKSSMKNSKARTYDTFLAGARDIEQEKQSKKSKRVKFNEQHLANEFMSLDL